MMATVPASNGRPEGPSSRPLVMPRHDRVKTAASRLSTSAVRRAQATSTMAPTVRVADGDGIPRGAYRGSTSGDVRAPPHLAPDPAAMGPVPNPRVVPPRQGGTEGGPEGVPLRFRRAGHDG